MVAFTSLKIYNISIKQMNKKNPCTTESFKNKKPDKKTRPEVVKNA